ncbi:MAG: inositol monophosphatase family protein [Caldilineaceae bacterium]
MAITVFNIETIIAVARRAGQLVIQLRRDGLRNVRGKSNEIDLVTEADLASEALIREALQEAYPFVGFWGEESNQQPKEEFFWVVDPVDGTVNYANGVPFYAVNIALQQGETTLMGVTVQLPSGHIYWAKRGDGAFLRNPDGDQRRIFVNHVDHLAGALLTTGFPYHRADSPDNNSSEFVYFLTHAQGVRCMGSAALDLANVATGALAGFWEGWLNPWDVAPGALLVREAGGQVTDYNGKEWSLLSRSAIASNGRPNLHRELLEGVQQARAGLTESRLA